MSNTNMHSAKRAKNDEFYTQLPDIENELKHYRKSFKDKVIYLNCDDSRSSNFWRYFAYNFEKLGLKKLIATGFIEGGNGIYSEYNGDKNNNNVPDKDEITTRFLQGDGDFRSDESIKILKEADIIVTNPPFSLFREYVAQLMEYDKKFLIIGAVGAASYKEIFKLIKDNKLWLGTNHPKEFMQPNGTLKKFGNITWFTNLPVVKRDEDIILYKKYNPTDYPEYDNFKAINVDKVKDIPMDYWGAMGVPITFLDKFNPKQFEIIDGIGRYSMLTGPTPETKGTYLTKIDGNPKYARIIIKRVK